MLDIAAGDINNVGGFENIFGFGYICLSGGEAASLTLPAPAPLSAAAIIK